MHSSPEAVRAGQVYLPEVFSSCHYAEGLRRAIQPVIWRILDSSVIAGRLCMSKYLLAIDQGTTSSRALLFDCRGHLKQLARREFPQHFPGDGMVEHDPEDIWQSVLAVTRQLLDEVDASEIIGLGITNQRETTLIWERSTGKPLARALVWQDRRTAPICRQLREAGHEPEVSRRTGLLLDPYFSATKVAWLLDSVPGARARAEQGDLAFGTVDSFLLWRLTAGRVHATDATNASRTGLYNIHTGTWDQELLRLYRVPFGLLPEVRDSAADFGKTDRQLLGAEIPIAALAGDQQAALIGQACIREGMVKSTYGTGCFVIANTGDLPLQSSNRLLTTVAWQLQGRVAYGLEGSIFMAGALIQWLRDGLGLIKNPAETEAIAEATGTSGGVYLVPAFTGLGAPYWDPGARGALLGLTRDSGREQIVTAALEAVAFQTRDLFLAMDADGIRPRLLRLDGGMAANNWFCQRLADTLGITVDRPEVIETTALGAALLAGLQQGVFNDLASAQSTWQLSRQFAPAADAGARNERYKGWKLAVARVR